MRQVFDISIWAGLVAARRAIDDENARWRLQILLPAFGGLHVGARLQPFDRHLEVGVCEAFAGFARARALVIALVGYPRRLDDSVEFGHQRIIIGIVKAGERSLCEFGLAERDARHAGARLGLGHGGPPAANVP
jgi:hypothetical protein